MPQLAVNMKVNTRNKISRNLKKNHFKLRHAPYSNRYKTMPHPIEAAIVSTLITGRSLLLCATGL